MRKFFRYLFQYAILAALGAVIYQTAFRHQAPPVHDRAHWTQRDGFVAVSYGGLTMEEGSQALLTKVRLREQLTALAKAGYETVTTADLAAFYRDGAPLPEKALYVLFEGGRKDSVLFSQPVLAEVGFNASLYLYGDRLSGWNRFFVRRDELAKIAGNPHWDVGAMGYHSGLINRTPSGGYAYYLTERLRGGPGEVPETPEAFARRVAEDYVLARTSIEDVAGVAPLGYVFMPGNTLGVTLPEALAAPNAAALEANFPVAFTRVGETYNAREADPRRLTRLQVGPDWTADRLLLEIESREPRTSYRDFSRSLGQGLWQVALGELAYRDDALVVTPPRGKDAFVRLRGTEGFENFLANVSVSPPEGGAAFLYLRYQGIDSFARLRVTSERVQVQEKLGSSLNTIAQYVLPLDHAGPVALDVCLKANRLLLGVDGAKASPYPIPLSAGTSRGSLALGAGDEGAGGAREARFAGLTLASFPPRWIAAPGIGAVPLAEARTLTAVVLPLEGASADPAGDAAALITAAASGVAVQLDLSGREPRAAAEFVRRLVDSASGLIYSRLLRGVVLSLGTAGDLGELGRVMAELRARGQTVTLRLEASDLSRLLDAVGKLDPDWLLFDAPPPEDDARLVTLENRFDRSRLLFRQAGAPGEKTVVYAVER